jgi:predicted dehydrogenase
VTLRAAVIGCGAIGASGARTHPEVGVLTHAAAYTACTDTELVAVCDADPERARAAAHQWGAEAYTDAAALLRAGCDVISVCTPDATHAELVALALEAPSVRAILAEKPLALDASAAQALARRARDRGVVLAVNYTRRYAPAFQSLRGRVGALQHVSGVYVKGLFHNGTHWLDLLRFLGGHPIAVRGWDRLGETGPDPSLEAELTLGGRASARLAALDTRRFTAFEMDLLGEGGRIRIAESGHVVEVADLAADPRHPGYRVLGPAERTAGALHDAALHAVVDLVRCLRDGGDPACTGEDGAAAIALAEAVRASAARGGERIDVTFTDPVGMIRA